MHSRQGFFEIHYPRESLGEDSFQYRLVNQNYSADSGNVKVWVAKTANSPEWTSLHIFGIFFQEMPLILIPTGFSILTWDGYISINLKTF